MEYHASTELRLTSTGHRGKKNKVVSFDNAQAGPKTTGATLQVENTLVSASPSASGTMQIDPSSRPADLNLRIIHAQKNTDESVITRSSKRRKLLPIPTPPNHPPRREASLKTKREDQNQGRTSIQRPRTDHGVEGTNIGSSSNITHWKNIHGECFARVSATLQLFTPEWFLMAPLVDWEVLERLKMY